MTFLWTKIEYLLREYGSGGQIAKRIEKLVTDQFGKEIRETVKYFSPNAPYSEVKGWADENGIEVRNLYPENWATERELVESWKRGE